MKTWQVVLLSVGGVAVVCCGGGAFIGMRLFNGAKAADAEADHFADAFFQKIGKDWDPSAVQSDLAPEWLAQPKEIQDAYMKVFKDRLGPLKSAEPFSSINTSASSNNGRTSTLVSVMSHAKFAKADGTVTMTLRRTDDVWRAVNFKIDSDALHKPPAKKEGGQ